MTIFVVTMGEHDDYRIIGATTVREDAERIASIYHGYARVEEYEQEELAKEGRKLVFEAKFVGDALERVSIVWRSFVSVPWEGYRVEVDGQIVTIITVEAANTQEAEKAARLIFTAWRAQPTSDRIRSEEDVKNAQDDT